MSVFQRGMRLLFVYVWMALLAVAIKVITPFWNESSWTEVLVIIPLGATVVWFPYQFLARTILARLEERRHTQ